MSNIEIKDTINVVNSEGSATSYEIVATAQEENDDIYHVGYSEAEDNFAIFTTEGKILEDEKLSREILDDFSTHVNTEA